MAGDRPLQDRDSRWARSLLGQAGAGNLFVRVISGRQVLDSLCRTRHYEGGQDVFAFPPAEARFVRWNCGGQQLERSLEIVEINLYGPADAASVVEQGRVAALGQGPSCPLRESITVDFGRMRSPLGAFIEWGEDYGTIFSVHLSDDGESFREVGRILTGSGSSDSFWWRSTTARFFRLTVHEASSPEGAIVNELKLRVLNKDRMPIGQLERAALEGRGDLYPQSLLRRQVYLDRARWIRSGGGSSLRRIRQSRAAARIRPDDALPQAERTSAGSAQQRVDQSIPGRRLAAYPDRRLVGGRRRASRHRARSRRHWPNIASPIAVERPRRARLFSQCVRFRSILTGSMAATPPSTRSRSMTDVSINDKVYAAFSSEPAAVSIADFEDGDVIPLIDKPPHATKRDLRAGSGLLSAAVEFAFSLRPGRSATFLASFSMRDGVTRRRTWTFAACAKP
jgi:hypothetical protein